MTVTAPLRMETMRLAPDSIMKMRPLASAATPVGYERPALPASVETAPAAVTTRMLPGDEVTLTR